MLLQQHSLLDLSSAKHPVHIIKNNSKMSTSAFIPFCEFGGNMSGMGVKIDQFELSVCNSFQAKILNDQLCFEIDLNRFHNKYNIAKELKLGFYFLMDYNEDRQAPYEFNLDQEKGLSMEDNILEYEQYRHAIIYVDTIGMNNDSIISFTYY